MPTTVSPRLVGGLASVPSSSGAGADLFSSFVIAVSLNPLGRTMGWVKALSTLRNYTSVAAMDKKWRDPPGRDIVVVGASLGGVEAISRLASQLPEDLPAALFVVLHTFPAR